MLEAVEAESSDARFVWTKKWTESMYDTTRGSISIGKRKSIDSGNPPELAQARQSKLHQPALEIKPGAEHVKTGRNFWFVLLLVREDLVHVLGASRA